MERVNNIYVYQESRITLPIIDTRKFIYIVVVENILSNILHFVLSCFL